VRFSRDGLSSQLFPHRDWRANLWASDCFVSVNNIEVETNTAQFLHAWVQKNFSDDRLSVLAGLYAVDSEFCYI